MAKARFFKEREALLRDGCAKGSNEIVIGYGAQGEGKMARVNVGRCVVS